jgi:cation diffusion facilitator CzcD-associated flavoprotein CzcO
VILGLGNSAADIAVELSEVAASTTIACRGTPHLVPRRVAGIPADLADNALTSLLPFRVRQAMLAALIASLRKGWRAYGLPRPAHGLLRRVPVTATGFGERVREGAIALRPWPSAGGPGRLEFPDGSAVPADHVLCATGFDIAFPFLPDVRVDTRSRPLYRRIVDPGMPGLFFVGLIDPNAGLFPVLEAQSEWIEREDRARARRFVAPVDPATWLLCDRYPYVRRLARDRLARLTPWR